MKWENYSCRDVKISMHRKKTTKTMPLDQLCWYGNNNCFQIYKNWELLIIYDTQTFPFVKIGLCQVKQSIQVVQSVDTS